MLMTTPPSSHTHTTTTTKPGLQTASYIVSTKIYSLYWKKIEQTLRLSSYFSMFNFGAESERNKVPW